MKILKVVGKFISESGSMIWWGKLFQSWDGFGKITHLVIHCGWPKYCIVEWVMVLSVVSRDMGIVVFRNIDEGGTFVYKFIKHS